GVLRLDVAVRASWPGRARSFLLRAAPLRIVLSIPGRSSPVTRRYVASMGSSGFLVSPFIETSPDLAKAYVRDGASLPAVATVRFESDPADRRFFDPVIRVRVLGGDP